MPSLDLSTAKRIASADGDITKLEGIGFGWEIGIRTQFPLTANASNNSVSIISATESSLSAGDPSSGRRTIAWQHGFPASTRIRCNVRITGTGNLYFRIADTDGLGPSGHVELIPAISEASGDVSIDITLSATQAAKPWIGFLKNTGSSSYTITNWRVDLPAHYRAPVELISDYYGVGAGKIAIHLSTDGAIQQPDGTVTAVRNLGGAGSVFDATVIGSGSSIDTETYAAPALNIAASSYLSLANPAELVGVRLMVVLTTDQLATTATRLFGNNVSGNQSDIISDYNNGTRIRAWRQGVGWSTNTGRLQMPTTGLHLLEMQLSGSEIKFYLDGNNFSTGPFTASSVAVFMIGRGNNAGNPFVGKMNDVLGVTLGTGSDEAITVARKMLAAKYGITIT